MQRGFDHVAKESLLHANVIKSPIGSVDAPKLRGASWLDTTCPQAEGTKLPVETSRTSTQVSLSWLFLTCILYINL